MRAFRRTPPPPPPRKVLGVEKHPNPIKRKYFNSLWYSDLPNVLSGDPDGPPKRSGCKRSRQFDESPSPEEKAELLRWLRKRDEEEKEEEREQEAKRVRINKKLRKQITNSDGYVEYFPEGEDRDSSVKSSLAAIYKAEQCQH